MSLCTFIVAAIFLQGHPYIWRTTIHHDVWLECRPNLVLLGWVEDGHATKQLTAVHIAFSEVLVGVVKKLHYHQKRCGRTGCAVVQQASS